MLFTRRQRRSPADTLRLTDRVYSRSRRAEDQAGCRIAPEIGNRGKHAMIVQQLNRIQARHGYLPRESLVALAERLAVPLYRVQEVVSFFPHYHRTPPPEIEVHV